MLQHSQRACISRQHLRQELHEARGVEVERPAVNVEQEIQHFVAAVEINRRQRLLICGFEAAPQTTLAVFCDEMIDFFEI